jgi:hypothetical protein
MTSPLTFAGKFRRPDYRRARRIMRDRQWPETYEEYSANCDRPAQSWRGDCAISILDQALVAMPPEGSA